MEVKEQNRVLWVTFSSLRTFSLKILNEIHTSVPFLLLGSIHLFFLRSTPSTLL